MGKEKPLNSLIALYDRFTCSYTEPTKISYHNLVCYLLTIFMSEWSSVRTRSPAMCGQSTAGLPDALLRTPAQSKALSES